MKRIIIAAIISTAALQAYAQTLSPAPGAKGVNIDTHLCISFDSVPLIGSKGFIKVYDAADDRLVDVLDMSIPAGPTESRSYGPDCDYTRIPYDYSRTTVPTNRDTTPGTPSGTAERTPADYQLTIIGGFTDGFHFHPVIVRGNTAVIYLHNNMLEPEHSYYVCVDKGVLGKSFKTVGKEWSFTTGALPDAASDTLRVNANGSADFSTLQGALDFIPDWSSERRVIMVARGDYEEIVYARNKSNIKIKGEGMYESVIHYANNEVFNPHPMTVKTNERPGTFPQRRAAVAFDNCSDMLFEDIGFHTDLSGQAEGLMVNGERMLLNRIHIVGSGDALQANGSIYMEDCEIDGGADTILGRGALFAKRCNFRNNGGPFSWVRNTEGIHGDVFVDCSFATDSEHPADFGRSRLNHGSIYPFAEVVLINCRTHNITESGWGDVDQPTAVLMEYNTRDMLSGKPVDTSKRHKYSCELTMEDDAETIARYSTPECILKGWTPIKW